MDGAADELTHDDIWDDSALVESWNDALAEYKKYHSIHATGAKLVDLPEHQNSHAKLETDDRPDASTSHRDGANSPPAGGTLASADQAYIGGDDDLLPATQHTRPVGDVESEKQNQSQGMNTGSNGGTACDIVPPQALLGSVKDEGLKKLLMSWYYAGYYTGLYEGQQKRPEQGQ